MNTRVPFAEHNALQHVAQMLQKDKHQPTFHADVCGNPQQYPTQMKI